MNKLENRSYNFEMRADESTDNVLVGTAVVFDKVTNLGCFDEVIDKRALKDTDLTDVRFLVNHDTSKIPLARSRRNNGNSTMTLKVTQTGLDIKATLDVENNTEAQALMSAVKRGDISGMSFMFSVKEDEWDDVESNHPKRTIKAIESIVEVSAVSFPAYKDAKIAQARDNLKVLENARQALENAKSRAVDTASLELLKAKLKIRMEDF